MNLSPEQGRWPHFRAGLVDFGRTLIVPSDTPPDLSSHLEKAVDAVLTDPKVPAEYDDRWTLGAQT